MLCKLYVYIFSFCYNKTPWRVRDKYLSRTDQIWECFCKTGRKSSLYISEWYRKYIKLLLLTKLLLSGEYLKTIRPILNIVILLYFFVLNIIVLHNRECDRNMWFRISLDEERALFCACAWIHIENEFAHRAIIKTLAISSVKLSKRSVAERPLAGCVRQVCCFSGRVWPLWSSSLWTPYRFVSILLYMIGTFSQFGALHFTPPALHRTLKTFYDYYNNPRAITFRLICYQSVHNKKREEQPYKSGINR